MKIRNPLVASIVAAFIAVALIQSPLEAAPPRGSVAPPITLKDLSGETVSTTKFANNEPARTRFRQSQINVYVEEQRGEGIQQLASLVKDIVPTVKAMRATNGLEFL